MNNPFDYVPSEAMRVEQRRLVEEIGRLCSADPLFAEEIQKGKMFGILRTDKEVLWAYSGQVCGRFDYPGFVPAVFDYLAPDGYFKQEEARIVEVSREIERLKNGERFVQCVMELNSVKEQANKEIESYRAFIKAEKARPEADVARSQYLNAEMHRKKVAWREIVAEKQRAVDEIEGEVRELKMKRQRMSDALQRWLFEQYKLVNYRGETITLDSSMPSATGDCCEPKLLQYAYKNGLEPLEIGMFWWGESTKGEIRHHLQFYPACQGKCRLILPWVLGVKSEERRVKNTPQAELQLEVLFEDEDIIVVNKPSGMLSVPGKGEDISALELLREQFGEGVQSVHRLDMDTSGVMVFVRNTEAHKCLQRQFEEHTIQKTYRAELENPVEGKGRIELPLRPDIDDRPRQIVDFKFGKTAISCYKALENCWVELKPLTGRTHQLRVHCAHPQGLNNPIKGDRLYGNKCKNNSRLQLYAHSIEFTHPRTGERVRFKTER